jgi:hypothetical protein
MLGQEKRRGIPVCWCCICWGCVCFIGPTYTAKSKEEQEVLMEQWNALRAGEKFKLWMKRGFRWKYPDMLGPEPEKVKSPFAVGEGLTAWSRGGERIQVQRHYVW